MIQAIIMGQLTSVLVLLLWLSSLLFLHSLSAPTDQPCGVSHGEEQNATCIPCKSGNVSTKENHFQCDPCSDYVNEETSSGQCWECTKGYGIMIDLVSDICVPCDRLTAEVILLQNSCTTTSELPATESRNTESQTTQFPSTPLTPMQKQITTETQLRVESTTNEQLPGFVTPVNQRKRPKDFLPEKNPSSEETDKQPDSDNKPWNKYRERYGKNNLSHGNISCIVIIGGIIVVGVIVAVTLCYLKLYLPGKCSKFKSKSKCKYNRGDYRVTTDEEKAEPCSENFSLEEIQEDRTIHVKTDTNSVNSNISNQVPSGAPHVILLEKHAYTSLKSCQDLNPAIQINTNDPLDTISNISNQVLSGATPMTLPEKHAFTSLTSCQDQNQAISKSTVDQSDFDISPNSEVCKPNQPDFNRLGAIQPVHDSATCEKAIGVNLFHAGHLISNLPPTGIQPVEDHLISNLPPSGIPPVEEENPNISKDQRDVQAEHCSWQSLRSEQGYNKDAEQKSSLVRDQYVSLPLPSSKEEDVQPEDKQPQLISQNQNSVQQLDLQNVESLRTGTHIHIYAPIHGSLHINTDHSKGTGLGTSQDTLHTIPTMIRSYAAEKVGSVPCTEGWVEKTPP